MKKLLVFLFLLALTLPGCAAPAASQPGTTQPQTQTAPQTTQPQEKNAWEWMKELAPDYDFTQLPKWIHVQWKEESWVGLELGEILQRCGTPIEARDTKDGLALTFDVTENEPLPVIHFSQNEAGKMVVTQTENLYFRKSGLTQEDFEAFQLNETTLVEVLETVGSCHFCIYTKNGDVGGYRYYLEEGGSVALRFGNNVLTERTFTFPESQAPVTGGTDGR